MANTLIKATIDTVYMVFASTFFLVIFSPKSLLLSIITKRYPKDSIIGSFLYGTPLSPSTTKTVESTIRPYPVITYTFKYSLIIDL